MKDKEKNQEFENLKKEFERIAKENYQLRKENKSMNDAIDKLQQEKRILLQRIKDEMKTRIEFEAELMIMKYDSKDFPF